MQIIQNKAKTLVDLLRSRSENQPDKLAYTFLEEGEKEAGSLTYKELDVRAMSIAAKLQKLNLQGERALLIYNSDLEYISAFFGCLYAGAISVPLHPPGKNKSLSRISAIAEDSGAKVTLSTAEIQNELEKDFANDGILKNIIWVDSDEISNKPADLWKEPKIDSSTLAYLQYTSGSTGVPKGVMVNHQNLLTNLQIIDKCHPHTDESVMVTWLPIFHDMGLIYGILLPFFGGYPCYFMTPQAFVQKPYRWLNAITKYKGTHNAAPNFAFELCVNKITEEQKKTLDLSTWTVAMNAAEPVRAETIYRFAEYFNECGFKLNYFCPGYGLAEGTLILSTTFKDHEPAMKKFDDDELEKKNRAVIAKAEDNLSKIHVGHSNAIEDTKMAIVNPNTLIECKEGEIGEVWASGISIAQGYWQREDATRETFKAYIANTNEGPFMRTGDLGFIIDNELYITGRHKDLIIIRGQNHYPQDIEYTVEASHPALRLGCVAAFSTDENGEERLGIVQEIQKNSIKDFDLDEIVKAIRRSVSEDHDLQVHSITLINPGTVPKTSSGKIQRKACMQGYLDNSLEIIAEWKQGEAIDFRKKADKKIINAKFILNKKNLKEWLVDRLVEMMQIKKDAVDVTEPFAVYGMDSLKAVQLSGDLESLLEKELPATLVYDYPTINSLSDFLIDDSKDKPENNDLKLYHDSKAYRDELSNEPIAIIGMGLRFPGADNVNEFWNNLVTGKDSIRKIPDGRWSKKSLNTSTITYGGFLDDVDKFDALYFGISPREAVQIDPQQRFTLEVTLQALEDAGINPETLEGTNVGVFMGICTYDYARFSSGKKELFDVYTGTGTSLSIAANRISYVFDFRGPSIAIDTACSSSLVALHTACQNLRSGQTDLAIAGGVNLLLSPDWNVVFTEADMLAPDGKCKTFDASADGYVRSEGCGIVVLKKLSDAVKDGDRIYSLIRGSALNQDGRSNGLTAPNGPSQEEVIKNALNNSGVVANQIKYVETHGTGTPLGDPIEVNSLTKVLAKDRDLKNNLYIGSVKTNIGHLEAAAGIAGVIKTSLALYNKEIPRHLNYRKLNPEILLEGTGVKVAEDNIKWDEPGRFAGISSFGFGGTNAHVILQEAPELKQSGILKSKPFNLFAISAKTENALQQLADGYIDFLKVNSSAKLEDICYSANTGRAFYLHRLAIVCSSVEDLRKKLEDFKNDQSSQRIISAITKVNHTPRIAFLFPGQGAQYIGMGKELYDSHPLFRNIINRCDEILRNYLDKPLLEVLFYEKDESKNPINETMYTQPALFSIEYALAKLWMSWGIKPEVMMGHSAGEYVAACLAGVFSLEDGLKLVTERGRLMQTLTSDGEMYTIFANEEQVKKSINGFEESVSIASLNGPQKVVISGDKNSVTKIISSLERQQVEFKKINVSIASHSPLMNSMIEEFRKVCNTIKYFSPEIPVVSNITGEIVTDKISNPDYWCEHILSGVRFSDGIKACVNAGCEFFIDLGPKPTSINMGQETIKDTGVYWLPSIKYNFTIWETMLQSLGNLYVHGADIYWENFDKEFAHKKISIPTYPFQRQRYWIGDLDYDKTNTADGFSAPGDKNNHPLLGSRLSSASKNEFIFYTKLKGDDPGYLKDHCVFDMIVLPGSAYIEIALSAGMSIMNKTMCSISNVIMHEILILDKQKYKHIQTILTNKNNKEFEFRIYSLEDSREEWTLHASGTLKYDSVVTKNNIIPGEIKSKYSQKLSVDKFYSDIRKSGVEYGKDFQAIKELYSDKSSVFARIILADDVPEKHYLLHPVLLDASFQSALSLLLQKENENAYIPLSIENMSFIEKGSREVWAQVELSQTNKPRSKNHLVNINIFSDSGRLISSVVNLELKEMSREKFLELKENLKDWFYEVKWEAKKLNGHEQVLKYDISELKSFVNSKLPDLIETNNLTDYKKGIEKLEELSFSFIVIAFMELGFLFVKDNLYQKKDLIEKLKISNSHIKLFGRLLEIFEEKKFIQIKEEKILVLKTPEVVSLPSIGKKIKTLKDNNSEIDSELVLLARCGVKLADVLTGKTDALQLLFPDGDLTSAEKLYHDSPAFRVMNETIKLLIEELLKNSDRSRDIRILENGAGTGSTSSYILSFLSSHKVKYTFTDISPAFFERAKGKFSAYEFLEYKVLDIEKEPGLQGFGENSYDLIIASNVIHATTDLKKSVENISKLLAPGGAVILNEVTEKFKWIDLTFGLTDGWWKFRDYNLRASYPLLDNNSWKSFLTNNGFDSIEIFSPSTPKYSYTGQSVIIGTKKPDSNNFNGTNRKQLLIFCETNTIKQIKPFLDSKSQKYIFVTNSDKFEKLSPSHFSINFSEKSDYLKIYNEVSVKSQGEIKIIYISKETGISKNKLIDTLITNHCLNVLNIIQTIPKAGFQHSPGICIVTTKAQAVHSHEQLDGLFQSSLWGLSKVISIEHPELNCKTIDLDKSVSPENLINEINFPTIESQVALRGNDRFVARMIRSRHMLENNIHIDDKSTYLITGGTGGLGILTADWLVTKGAKHIALVGRSGSTDMLNEQLKKLQTKETEVTIYKADITNLTEVKNILEIIRKSGYPLKGIIHSAGVLDDGILMNQSLEKLKKVMEPKISGAWYLHELTKDLELDFFVMYSSVASVLGSVGQANHSAANSFLDALAFYRQSEGLPALSINWGVWSEVGSAFTKGADKREKIPGIGVINPRQGIRALEEAMKYDVARVVIVPIDWKKYSAAYVTSFIENLITQSDDSIIKVNKKLTQDDFINKLRNSSPEEHSPLLINYFQNLISRIMGLDPEDMDPEQPLNTMGLDSLMAIELKNKVNMELGVDLNLVRYMEEINILQLSEELKEQLPVILNKKTGSELVVKNEISQEEKARDLLSNLENLSEEELDQLLDELK